MLNPYSTIAAWSVPCPSCRARRGQKCHTRKPSGYHVARADRGVVQARKDDYRQHERATFAQTRVRYQLRGGLPVDCRDLAAALACTCEDCGLSELAGLFAAAYGADQ